MSGPLWNFGWSPSRVGSRNDHFTLAGSGIDGGDASRRSAYIHPLSEPTYTTPPSTAGCVRLPPSGLAALGPTGAAPSAKLCHCGRIVPFVAYRGKSRLRPFGWRPPAAQTISRFFRLGTPSPPTCSIGPADHAPPTRAR